MMYNGNKNICEDTLEMPHSRKHQMKERWGTNKNKTNATYELTGAKSKKNYMQQRNRRGLPVPILADFSLEDPWLGLDDRDNPKDAQLG